MIYVRREKLKFVFMVAALLISISFVLKLLQMNPELTVSNLVERSVGGGVYVKKPHNHKDNGPKSKCGLSKPCPGKDFAFKIYSGATNIVGPQICFEGKMIIEKDTRGNWLGINIAVINEVEDLIEFLKSIEDGSLVLIASFDDPATKLNDEARALIAELGSSYISQLKFRDNWIFVGGKKTITHVSFETHMKNDRETNKYESWPEIVEMEGCIPRTD